MKPLHFLIILILFSIMFQISMSAETIDGNSSGMKGFVYEIIENDKHPIVSSQVSIYEEEILRDEIITDKDGSYEFILKPGMYRITVEKKNFITQTIFMIFEPNSTSYVDFHLERKIETYEVIIMIEGLPDDRYPEMLLDGYFYGSALNGTRLTFKGGTVHVIRLRDITDNGGRFIPVNNRYILFSEPGSGVFKYIPQFYISSKTNPLIEGWYDLGSEIKVETDEIIDLGNSTRMVFDMWITDSAAIEENPLSLKVNSSFQLDVRYRRQYLLTVISDRGTAEGGGWYYENSTNVISISDTEVGAMPFKYRFLGWIGDMESNNSKAMVLIDQPKTVFAEWERVELYKVEKLDPVYKAIIVISLLIFAAKIFSVLFAKVKLPEVLGELFAGILLGPYAFGSLKVLGEPIVEINEFVRVFAEVGAILLLFIAGLEISFGKFKAVGLKSAMIGTFGVIVPFVLGFYFLQYLGFRWEVTLLIAATLTATSIAITLRTLEELGKLNSPEGTVMINSAVIDDVLGLVILAVVLSLVTSGQSPQPFDIVWILFRTITFWLILLMTMLIIAPRIVGATERWKSRGTVEVAATATCFGSAVAAALIGLSPIIGAFAAGMALASSNVIARVRDFIEKLSILFSPIFFAVIGAEFNIRSLSYDGLFILLILTGIAIISKFVGCGIPAAIMLKNTKRGFRVGIGMISRGEVGLIIAGVGITSGILDQSIYGVVVTMVILTTVVSAILLRWSYRKQHITLSPDLNVLGEKNPSPTQ